MKKESKQAAKPKSAQTPRRRSDGKCSDRLSKELTSDDRTPPADRGDCEQESTTQGSE